MPRRQQLFEEAGGQRLPLGGVNRYAGVRSKQGKKKDKFQGTTPKKKHRTQLFATSLEAAIALAQLREDLELAGRGQDPSHADLHDLPQVHQQVAARHTQALR